MSQSISVNTKSRGRPKTTGTGQLIGVRLLPDQVALLDRWIADQQEPLSRPEAMRRLMILALQQEGVG